MEILIGRVVRALYMFHRTTNCIHSYLAVLRVLSVALMDLVVKKMAR